MAKSRKVLTSDRVLGLTRECPTCNRTITATGRLYYEPVLKKWGLGFWCPHDREEFIGWKPEYQTLIDQATTGVDPSTLPDESAASDR